MDNRDSRYDLIRSIAIIMIVFIHSMGRITQVAPAGWSSLSMERSALQSIVSMGVRLFILLSGALLLGKDEPAETFYRKRLVRILPPFLLWSILVFLLSSYKDGTLGWNCIPEFFRQLMTGGVHGTYWFVYMILGLYLITPLLRPLCQKRSTCTLLLGITTGIYVLHLVFPAFSWTERWFSDNVSCLMDYVTGYCIVRYLPRIPRMRSAAFLVTGLSVVLGFFLGINHAGAYPIEILAAMGLFTLVVTTPREPDLPPAFRLFGEACFGIYLSHCIFISALAILSAKLGMPVWADPLFIAGGVLVAEWVLMRLVRLARWDRILS